MSKFEWPLKHLDGKKITPSRFFFFFFSTLFDWREKWDDGKYSLYKFSLMPLLNKKIIYKGEKIIGEENKQRQN